MSNHKVALITGSARRIGAGLITFLHQLGFNVVIHYRQSKEAAIALQQQCLARRPHSAEILQGDLNDISSLSHWVQRAGTFWGRLDLLINNASQYFPTPLCETHPIHWLEIINSNLTAPYFLSQAAYPFLKAVKGSIINMSDSNIRHLHYSVYNCAKAGLNTLTQSLALELAPFVRINAIALGPTLLPEVFEESHPKTQAKIFEHIPLQRKCTSDDISRTVQFLIENPHITGQIIAIDGGTSIMDLRPQMQAS